MKEYWKKESSAVWQHFYRSTVLYPDGKAAYPVSVNFMQDFIERHSPVNESELSLWTTQASSYASSYSESVKRDISWARKCNQKQDEVLLFK